MKAAGMRGFSLIELMIAVAVTSGVAAAGYTVYSVQQRSFVLQEQMVEMHQNVRAFLFFVEKDLRMAGYDPLKEAGSGFLVAKPYEAVFTADLGRPRTDLHCTGTGCDSIPDGSIISSPCTDPPGCVTETIRYSLRDTPASNGMVTAPELTTAVTKVFNDTTATASNQQDVIQGVQGLEFLYNMADGTSTTDVLAAGQDLDDIRSVTVSMLIRTPKIIQHTREQEHCYYPASSSTPEKNSIMSNNCDGDNPWGPFNDAYRRSLVITTIDCRNMRLQNMQ